ncbi:hypothetical protein [Rhodococcus sp. IEGM 1374]|uniref:hypothetical protein n=1 Tax=Rhodococcus sp. IEGM 1374 TaxID=3082221 RepID=UPI0029553AAA|nr:hypothetical protein [Rhodococcus sp. IEGM 1374]MDV7991224.1 hypothetical protein [Rhodococcus sp. IEGM 1374]
MQQLKKATLKASKAVYGVLDQGVLSAGTFLLAVVIARTSTVEEFGAYGVIFTIFTLLITVYRSMFVMPYLLESGAAGEGAPSHSLRQGMISTSFVAAVVLFCIGAVSAAIVPGQLGIALLGLAIAAPILLFQDCLRYVVLHENGIRRVLVVDTVWVGSQACGQAIAVASGNASLFVQLVIWGATGGISLIAVPLITWARPTARVVLSFTRRALVHGKNLVLEAVMTSGSQYLSILALSSVAGLVLIAEVRASQLLLGPLVVVSQGLLTSLLPGIIKIGSGDVRRLKRICLAFGAGLFIFVVSFAGLLHLVPASVGSQFLGQSWASAFTLLWPLALAQAFGGLALGATLGYRGLGLSKETSVIRTLVFPLTPIAMFAGYALFDGRGAAFGLALASGITAAILWSHFLVIYSRRRNHNPAT